jgi:hypothetical protein
MASDEVEDGMGFSGLVPTAAERRQEVYEQTRRKIAQAREQQLAEAQVELARLREVVSVYRSDAERDHSLIESLRAENEIKDATLTLIASFAGKCLFSNTRGPDGDQAYREGSHAAWEQAADLASRALTNG